MTYTPHLNNTGHHWTPDEVVSLDFSGATGVILVNTNRYFMAGTSLRVYNQKYDITRGPLQEMITSCKSWRVFKTLFHNLQLQTMLIIVLYCLAIPLPCERFFAVYRLGENITQAVTIPQVFKSTILSNHANHWSYYKSLSDYFKATLI